MKDFFAKNIRTNEIKNEIDEITKSEEKIKRKDLKYKANKYLYDFQQFERIKFFGDSVYTGKVNIYEAEMDQSNLLEYMVKLNYKSKPNSKESKAKKQNTFDRVNALYEGRELTLNAFRSGIFPIKATQGKGLKILTPKQMLQILPIALTQVKAGSTSENLLNEIKPIIYTLYIEQDKLIKKCTNIK